MQNDLISRRALLEKMQYRLNPDSYDATVIAGFMKIIRQIVENAPAVDAVVLPEGRPGDYLEWKTGIMDHTSILAINAILICEDCVRYDLGVFAPTVDSENIVRIMSREEAKREIERRNNDGK